MWKFFAKNGVCKLFANAMVLLHRPGVEIERMTPLNAAHCLYSDILNKTSVDQEYSNFCGVLERWTNVYYVEDILEELLKDSDIRQLKKLETLDLRRYCSQPSLRSRLSSLTSKRSKTAITPLTPLTSEKTRSIRHPQSGVRR